MPIPSYSLAASLFDGVKNSRPVIFSVLDNNVSGEVYVDDAVNPRTALVVLLDILFLTGEGSTEVCEDVVDLLEREISSGKEWDYWDCYVFDLFILALH